MTTPSTPARLPVRTAVPASLISRIAARSILRFMDYTIRMVLWMPRHTFGLNNLNPTDTQFIIACNHLSLVDGPMLHLELPWHVARKTAIIGGLDFFAPRADGSWLHIVWRRIVVWFLRSSINVLMIDRRNGDYESIEKMCAPLDRGWNLVIYPEATRSRSGKMGRMHLGVAAIARQYNCRVIPTHITGTDETVPVGGILPRKTTLLVRFGTPLEMAEDESRRAFVERLRCAITALGEKGDAA